MPSLLSNHPLDRAKLNSVIESAAAEGVIPRAITVWAAYMALAVIAATLFTTKGVGLYDAIIGIPFAYGSSWLWSHEGDGTTGGAVLLFTFTLMIGFVAGAF